MAILKKNITYYFFAFFLIGCIPVQPPSDEERAQWHHNRNDPYIRYRVVDPSTPNGWRELPVPQVYIDGEWADINEPIKLKNTDKFYRRWENGKWVDCAPPQQLPPANPTEAGQSGDKTNLEKTGDKK